ncbi:bifunctional phosphoribosyl-AMP cyclohydrolase/phosphoribosyl-ATP diphosphatase HisIE [Lewinella sp. JB7]|uniref:bifunctional phosphoribosyl-AMP cyclohydrolase/phosphoribosyl-ATP diphosphatase HisIE n=1 Tax=Lewinella sp. JB7 TaxID=2962887 RepID=UPI0020C95288|nr:bifunctional phosphoribosyl-AMP cyclohydrolase/phosphoribosyl-ATP diphosphatase HisIE [Lewinella sp. JB7]MCP9237005.1 bifunctional phosphoribosyl-AMP cyclohydrolase/phosphoribosyl-ATP diphosphatase HisIE [Lewinella sp. JB7]
MQVNSDTVGALAFDKENGLLPAIVQDNTTRVVLMQGYMNAEALERTMATGRVTFFSRSKQRLWTKGETSGNVLQLVRIDADCDRDSLLIQATPTGPVCHTGTDTCWAQANEGDFIDHLEATIQDRRDHPSESSYTTSLLRSGINKVAQKVGEEAVELVIEAKDDNKDLFLGEAADLLYHYLVLLAAKGYTLEEVREVLRQRHR